MLSSESDEAGPNVFVSRNVEVPEGASISDLDKSDTDDGDDPHKALGNIVLDDFLELPTTKTKEKKMKKKSKRDDATVTPDLVEHKSHKKKKDKKKKSSKAEPAQPDEDLLGLAAAAAPSPTSSLTVWSSDSLLLSLEPGSCRVQGHLLSCSLTVTNMSQGKLQGVRVARDGLPPCSLAKSLKPGVAKSKAVSLQVGEGRPSSLPLSLSWEGGEPMACSLPLPASSWLMAIPPALDTEQYAELLLSGALSHSLAVQLAPGLSFLALLDSLAATLALAVVEVVEGGHASLYGEAVDGGRLAFLLKAGAEGCSLEGRGEDRQLLEGLLAQAQAIV